MEKEGSEQIEGNIVPDKNPSLPPVKKVALYVIFLLFVSSILSFFSGDGKNGLLLFALSAVFFVLYVQSLSDSEKQWFKKKQEWLSAEFDEGLQQSLEPAEESKGDTVKVCRECRQEVSRSVKRCPYCGWKPKKRGGLWWGTTAVMSLNPIGWAMAAKGAKDKHEASKGVWEETTAPEKQSSGQEEIHSDSDPIEKLERLNELRESGVIDEDEFTDKKQELLEQV